MEDGNLLREAALLRAAEVFDVRSVATAEGTLWSYRTATVGCHRVASRPWRLLGSRSATILSQSQVPSDDAS
jgi:hypothetical protein